MASVILSLIRCLLCLAIVIDLVIFFFLFFFHDTATTEIYTLSLHDALPISGGTRSSTAPRWCFSAFPKAEKHQRRSEEHTSELQSLTNLVCRLLLEKKKKTKTRNTNEEGKRTTLNTNPHTT